VVVVHSARVTWSGFPPPDAPGQRARIDLGGQRLMRLRGFASLHEASFLLRRRLDVVPGHLWLHAATPLEVLGEDANGLVVVPGRDAEAGARPRVTIACRDVDYATHIDGAARRPRARDAPLVHLKTDDAPLSVAPGGCAFTSLSTREGLHEIERRDGFVRVRGGTYVGFDGWLRASDVRRDPGERSWGPGCGPPDDVDVCPDAIRVVADTTPVFVRGAEIGAMEAGAQVVAGERRGDLVAIELLGREVTAPDGERFFVRASALQRLPEAAAGAALDDGCP
jgi:hypothetical protein